MPLPEDYIHPERFMTQRGAVMKKSSLHPQSWVNPAAIDDNGYVASFTPPAAASTVAKTIDGALATGGIGYAADGYARNVIVTVTADTAIIAMNGVITGTDIFDNVITAAWAVTATGTSKTSATAKAFKTVTGFTITVAEDASGDNHAVIVGDGDVLGCDAVNTGIVPIQEQEDGGTPTAGVMVAGVASHATADAWGTYDPNSALNGALDFDIWYVVDDPQLTNDPGQRGD